MSMNIGPHLGRLYWLRQFIPSPAGGLPTRLNSDLLSVMVEYLLGCGEFCSLGMALWRLADWCAVILWWCHVQSSRAPSIEDDEDGHLIYHHGDVLQDRCSWNNSVVMYFLQPPKCLRSRPALFYSFLNTILHNLGFFKNLVHF